MEKKPFRFAEGERGGAGERPFCPECHATSFVIDLSIGETRLLTVDHPSLHPGCPPAAAAYPSLLPVVSVVKL